MAEEVSAEKVVRWMRTAAGEYTDGKTGEINATELAEAAAYNFDLYEEDGETIPEWVFELSAKVSDE